ncbi:MAG TPA: leucine-rich repeat protein [Gallicola sp.]|nr:leucine-rich repeat protein [Gallicola sp.]
MGVYKCKVCAGTIELNENQTTATCNYCGVEQSIPNLKTDLIYNLYDRANHFLRTNEYEKAEQLYEQILKENYTESEAYWSLVLCKYGVEYIDSSPTEKTITINRTQNTSVFDDVNYLQAIKHADFHQEEIYKNDAQIIENIQKQSIHLLKNEDPYDVFICYKQVDEYGKRTEDSVIAEKIYNDLTKEGYKVFFSMITLEKKLGVEYEPYIYAALSSSKIMVVVGTDLNYINATWVKNEWYRFINMMNEKDSNKHLIPLYKNFNPYDLPIEFSHLQALDMSNIAYRQDLLRGIKKLLPIKGKIHLEEELKIGFDYIRNKDWVNANFVFNRILEADPLNVMGNLGKLLAEYKVENQEGLGSITDSFSENKYFKHIMLSDNEKLKNQLLEYLNLIEESKKDAKKEVSYLTAIKLIDVGSYNRAKELLEALGNYKDSQELLKKTLTKLEDSDLENQYNLYVGLMKSAKTAKDFEECSINFKKIIGYLDSENLMNECLKKANMLNSNKIYVQAKKLETSNNVDDVKKAIEYYKKIIDYKDSNQRIESCEKLILSLEEKAKNRKRKNKKIIIITSVVLTIALISLIIALALRPNYTTSLEFELTSNDTYKVVGIRKNKKDVVIPNMYKNKKVTNIGSKAFENNENIVSITIPRNVKIIEEKAFQEAKQLSEVIISVDSDLLEIGDYAFADTIKLYNFDFPSSLKTIGKWAFANSGIKKANLGINLTSVEHGAFEDTKLLQEVNFDPRSKVNRISDKLFNFAISLNKITFPESVKEIGDYSFANTQNLGTLTLPNSVEEIGEGIFFNASGLTTVNLPSSLKKLSENAFIFTENLREINISSSNNYFKTVSGILYNKDMTTLLKFPERKLLATYAIPEGVKTIGYGAFSFNFYLLSVDFADSIETIGYSAFAATRDLYTIRINETSNLKTIESYAFEETSLKNFVIPDSVTTMGEGIFYYSLNTNIFTTKTNKQTGWDNNWDKKTETSKFKIYWRDDWYLDSNNVPRVKAGR